MLGREVFQVLRGFFFMDFRICAQTLSAGYLKSEMLQIPKLFKHKQKI
jgi:hypothetical protein